MYTNIYTKSANSSKQNQDSNDNHCRQSSCFEAISTKFMLMHGLINNLEWYDYIYIDICRHGFNYYNFIILFFFFAENEPLLSIHEFRKFSLRGPKYKGGGGQLQIFAVSNMNSTTN